eukprot:TRINITY_DN5898_c0_g1_i1.p1 TRINITY_DN5898_c0_g1~~TRINITY_DN5898_c0_g1_i1.p1  ORF type:complete len:386 (+),score=87.02 TRINITY_DN5898_c0_g1_i1:24-1160(+)
MQHSNQIDPQFCANSPFLSGNNGYLNELIQLGGDLSSLDLQQLTSFLLPLDNSFSPNDSLLFGTDSSSAVTLDIPPSYDQLIDPHQSIYPSEITTISSPPLQNVSEFFSGNSPVQQQTYVESFQPTINQNCPPPFGYDNSIKLEDEYDILTKKRKKSQLKGDTAVSLAREQLLTISSHDLDMFAQSVSSTRKLTQEEQKELRVQRRLIKNREYAQSSRKKKKNYVGDLEATIANLTRENEELKRENNDLRSTLSQIRNYFCNIRQNTANSYPRSPPSHKVSTTGAVCLFVFLFSFGILFNFQSYSTSETSLNTGRVLLGNPEDEGVWALLNNYFSIWSAFQTTNLDITKPNPDDPKHPLHNSTEKNFPIQTREGKTEL